jgi:molybdate transport system substrate-binding protein
MYRAAFAAFFAFALVPSAPSEDVMRAFTSNGVKPAMEELFEHSEHMAGIATVSEFNTTAALKQKIESGAPFDFTLLTTEAIDDLIKKGKIDAGSRIEFARAGIGVGYRKGAPKPDIHDTEAVKKTLLAAKSVTFAEAGASRQYLEKMFVRLGIADQMKAKTILEKGSGQPQMDVEQGKAELVLTLVPEIPPYEGAALAGPLPAELQNYTSFAAGISSSSQHKSEAKALLEFITGPDGKPILKAKGLEPK